MARRIRIEDDVILTGGGAKNIGLVKSVSDYLDRKIVVPEEPLITGALGAAMLGKDLALKATESGKALETKKRVLEKVEIL